MFGCLFFILIINTQVRVSTIYQGLTYFCIPDVLTKENWDKQPHFSLCADQGGDQLSTGFGLTYHEPIKVNCTPLWDGIHGVNRDFWLSIDEAGLKKLMLVALIPVNLAHGPDETDLRFKQIRDVMAVHYNTQTAGLSPIFQADIGRIVSDLQDEVELEGDETMPEAIWKYGKENNMYRRKGYKTKISRFLALLSELKKLLQRWGLATFELKVVAVELDFIKKKALPHIELRTSGQDEASVGASAGTSSKLVTVDDRTLRSCGVNAVVLSLAVMASEKHRRLLAGVVCISGQLLKWHGELSRKCRSAKGSQEWLVSQLRGATMETCNEVFEAFEKEQTLEACDFLVSSSRNATDLDEQNIRVEDELAGALGSFGLALTKNRSRRIAYLFGYPHVLALCSSLGTDEEKTKVLRQFHDDGNMHLQMQREDNKNRLEVIYVDRSPFNTPSVQQLWQGAGFEEWQCTKRFSNHMDKRTLCVVTSQGVEDINNHQTNARQTTSWGSRYRRPSTAMATVIRDQVLQKVHKWDVIETKSDKQHATEILTKYDLAPLGHGSLDFKSVELGGQKAPYFSPSAEGVGLPTADLFVKRCLLPRGMQKDIANVWCGVFCNSKHQMCFKLGEKCANVAGVDANQWYVGLYHFKDSSCLAWPVEKVHKEGCSFQYLKFQKLTEPCFLTITTFEGVVAQACTCKSWAWQLAQGMQRETLRPALRFVVHGDAMPVLHIAAHNGFWKITRETLELIAHEVEPKVSVKGCVNLFDIIFALTKGILKCTDEEVLQHMEDRAAAINTKQTCYQEILAVDEAVACLEEEDQKVLRKEQDKVKEEVLEQDKFIDSLGKRMVEMSGGSVQATKMLFAKYSAMRQVPREHVDQKVAKVMLAPHSYLWRNRTADAWNSRYKKFPVKSAKDTAWETEHLALMECVRHSWFWYLKINGLSQVMCPIKGLFS